MSKDQITKLAAAKPLAGLEAAFNLHVSGRLRGLVDWLQFNKQKAPDELANAASELKDAELLNALYPDKIVRVGREWHAPRRANGTDMQEFDASIEEDDGTERMVVEIKDLSTPLTQGEDALKGVSHAVRKLRGRIADGAPIAARSAALVHFVLKDGENDVGGMKIDIEPDGSTSYRRPNGGPPFKRVNFYDEVARTLPLIDDRLLDEVILVDQRGKSTRIVREGNTWVRRSTRG